VSGFSLARGVFNSLYDGPTRKFKDTEAKEFVDAKYEVNRKAEDLKILINDVLIPQVERYDAIFL